MSKFISCADTAKLLRLALKEAFPEIKFSVRSSVYAGGASIDVGWIDGPKSDQVKAIVERFAGATFNGMTDYKGGHVHQFRGEEVHFGADFIFANRRISSAALEAKTTRLTPLSADDREQEAFRGDVWRAFNKQYDGPERLAWLLLMNAPQPAFDGRKSPLAESATILRSY